MKGRLRPAVAVAGAALLAVPIAAALLLRPGMGAQASATPASPTPAAPSVPSVRTHPGFPSPPLGAVVFARQFGHDDLALGLVPQSGRVLAQASVVSGQGVGVAGLHVSFSVDGARHTATACGRGCYRATLPMTGSPAAVVVDVAGGPATSWRVALPSPWPPPDGRALVDGAAAAMRSLRSVSLYETLGSGVGYVVASTWQLQAPDRLAYQVKGGSDAVIVGPRRWDRASGTARWVESPQYPLTQPVPSWVSVTDAHVLGTVNVRGRPAWRISFFDPGTPGWFEITIDKQTQRTYDVHMVATAHFMHDMYSGFNSTPPIRPPR